MHRVRTEVTTERGSTLLLGIGLAVVCLLGVVVVVDTTSAFLQRRSLMAVADAAALAGAQAMDMDVYYRDGARAGTRLESGQVVTAVRRHLARYATTEPEMVLDGVRTDGQRVWVQLARPIDLPFLSALHAEDVRVEGVARLDYRGIE
jgi:uncharacterized membrane protein